VAPVLALLLPVTSGAVPVSLAGPVGCSTWKTTAEVNTTAVLGGAYRSSCLPRAPLGAQRGLVVPPGCGPDADVLMPLSAVSSGATLPSVRHGSKRDSHQSIEEHVRSTAPKKRRSSLE
jgi:hypothetical protein